MNVSVICRYSVYFTIQIITEVVLSIDPFLILWKYKVSRFFFCRCWFICNAFTLLSPRMTNQLIYFDTTFGGYWLSPGKEPLGNGYLVTFYSCCQPFCVHSGLNHLICMAIFCTTLYHIISCCIFWGNCLL